AEVCENPGAQNVGHEVKFGLRRPWDAREKMIRAFDENNLARLRGRHQIAFERAPRAELIVIAGDEELGYGAAGGQEVVTVVAARGADGQAEPNEPAHARISAAGAQADVGTKGESGEEDRQIEA